jgi:hypothetical protein
MMRMWMVGVTLTVIALIGGAAWAIAVFEDAEQVENAPAPIRRQVANDPAPAPAVGEKPADAPPAARMVRTPAMQVDEALAQVKSASTALAGDDKQAAQEALKQATATLENLKRMMARPPRRTPAPEQSQTDDKVEGQKPQVGANAREMTEEEKEKLRQDLRRNMEFRNLPERVN